MEVLSPGILGSREEFIREWCGGREKIVSDPKALGSYLINNGLMIRRTRADVGRELPSITRVVQTINSDLDKIKEMKDTILLLAQKLVSGSFVERGQAAREIDSRMRQVTGIAKAPYVGEFAKTILDQKEKVVIFAWHREVYRVITTVLREFHPVTYMGENSPAQKAEAKRRFMLPWEHPEASNVIIMSLRSAPGLDGLQDVCSTCIYAELDWSPQVHEQDTGRIQRERSDGTENKVMEFFLLSEDGSDPVISTILGIKETQSYGLMNPTSEQETEIYQSDPDRVKRLVTEYLTRHQIKIPTQHESD